MCISTAVLIAASVTSTGGFTAFVVKKLGGKTGARAAIRATQDVKHTEKESKNGYHQNEANTWNAA
jgi:hypothetical protein